MRPGPFEQPTRHLALPGHRHELKAQAGPWPAAGTRRPPGPRFTDGPPATRVAVQHRRRFFRESMALVLEREADLFVVTTPSTGPELVKVAEEDHLDLVVLELDVTDWDPCWLVPALRRHHRHLAVVGTRPGVQSCPPERAHQAGVQTVFPHGAGVAAFMGAVRTVLSRAPMPATARVVALEAPAPHF